MMYDHRAVSPWLIVFVVMPVLMFVLLLPEMCLAQETSTREDNGFSDMMCGPYCLWLATASLGRTVSVEELCRLAGTTTEEGTSAQNMVRAARLLGLEAQAVQTNVRGLSQKGRCVIVILDSRRHFAFVKQADDRGVTLVEDLRENPMTLRDFKTRWAGLAIVIGRKGDSLTSVPHVRSWGLWVCVFGAVLVLIGGTAVTLNGIAAGCRNIGESHDYGGSREKRAACRCER
jgi:ABC-type bacteriocin/lantibiotic exporter with double-glycine peptidase domain